MDDHSHLIEQLRALNDLRRKIRFAQRQESKAFRKLVEATQQTRVDVGSRRTHGS